MLIKRHLPEALSLSLLTALLTLPVLGVHLQVDGLKVALQGNARPVVIAMTTVFLVRLFQDLLKQIYAWLNPSRLLPSPERLATYRAPLLTLLVIAALIWPFFASRGAVDVGTLSMIYVMLGLGLNIVVGYAGLLDLGYVAFYAVGAYSYALLAQNFDLSFWKCLPVSVGMAATAGCLLGFPVLRLRGDYLAIVTLGFGEIIYLLLNNLDNLTGGPDGVKHIPKPTFFGLEFAREPGIPGGITFHQPVGWVERSETHRQVEASE